MYEKLIDKVKNCDHDFVKIDSDLSMMTTSSCTQWCKKCGSLLPRSCIYVEGGNMIYPTYEF